MPRCETLVHGFGPNASLNFSFMVVLVLVSQAYPSFEDTYNPTMWKRKFSPERSYKTLSTHLLFLLEIATLAEANETTEGVL